MLEYFKKAFVTLQLYLILAILLVWNPTLLSDASNMVHMKIVDEPTNYGANVPLYQQLPSIQTLKTRVMPSNFSGPPHLQRLCGRCYTKIIGEYKYELCPFANITQHEQALRWNAYNGVLGVWKEWVIENNTFVAMAMSDGDSCGSSYRSAEVLLVCGNRTEIKDVAEPRTCEYVVRLATPLFCHPDSLLVFPTLGRQLQDAWDELEGLRVHNIVTQKGYRRRLRELFIRAGYQTSDDQWRRQTDAVSRAEVQQKQDVGEFATLYECRAEYRKLQTRVGELERLLQEHGVNSSTTVTTDK